MEVKLEDNQQLNNSVREQLSSGDLRAVFDYCAANFPNIAIVNRLLAEEKARKVTQKSCRRGTER